MLKLKNNCEMLFRDANFMMLRMGCQAQYDTFECNAWPLYLELLEQLEYMFLSAQTISIHFGQMA